MAGDTVGGDAGSATTVAFQSLSMHPPLPQRIFFSC